MHSIAVYVKEGLLSALENTADFYLFLTGFTLFSVLLAFPLEVTCSSLCTFLDTN